MGSSLDGLKTAGIKLEEGLCVVEVVIVVTLLMLP